MNLLDNPIGCLTSPKFFRAKALQKCFIKEAVLKLKFPNSSNIKTYIIKKG
jgi:hypothetical protein